MCVFSYCANLSERAFVLQVVTFPVVGIKLRKVGAGWSSAQKFFCTPVVRVGGVETHGATTFIKLGEEGDVEREYNVTRNMMILLGNHVPQVIGYAEAGETAGMLLSLANLGEGGPMGFSELFRRAMTAAAEGALVVEGQPVAEIALVAGLEAKLPTASPPTPPHLHPIPIPTPSPSHPDPIPIPPPTPSPPTLT